MKIFDIVKDGGALLIRSTDSQNEYSIPIGAGVKNRIDYGIDWIDIYSGDNVIWSGLATSILSVGGAPSPLDVTDLVAAISSEIALISGGNIQSEIDLLQGTIDEAFARIVTVENRPVGNSGEGKRYFISTPATAGIYAATETFTGSPTTITKTFTNVYQTIVEAETDALNITVIPSGNWNTDISFTHTNGKDFTAKLSFYDDTTLLEEIESDILPGTEKIVLSKTFQTFGFTSGNKLKLKLEAKSNHNGDISVYTNDGTKDLHIHTPILIDVVNSAVQNALNLMQNKIVQVASQSAMLALTGKSVGDIVSRTDDNNYLYNLTALPASSLSNWEVIGKDAQPVGETVEDIITTNEVITSKVNGLYAFTGTPNGGFPAGVTQGDIAQKTASVWTVVYTFINAPAAIFANSDGKTYFKTINGANINTWQAKSEPSVYEVGPDKQYTTLQSAVDAYQADFTSGRLSVGVISTYQTLINENVTIGGSADIQNLMIEGYGVQGSANVQITKLTIGAFAHRIKLKNVMCSNTISSAPLLIQSAGTCTENGVANTPRGKHFFDNVTLSTPNATSLDITSCDNFINFNNCDLGGKIVNVANKTGTATSISINGCSNGILNIGNNRIVTKNNSASVYRGTISASAIILDVDTATPIAYSILRTYTALGASVPIALGSMIINDDVGGGLQNLKCKTAYTIAGNLGVGTAIDLTKYDVQASGASMTVGTVQTANFTALPNYIYPCDNTSAAITVTLPANPATKDTIQLIDYANKWSTNNLTINPNGKRINSSLLNIIINTNNANPTLTYIDATEGWALQVASAGSSMTVTAVKTANFTATKNTINPTDTTSASVTATLPLAANSTAGDIIELPDYANTYATNNLIINPNGGKINGSSLNVVIATNNANPRLVYIDATQGWLMQVSNASGLVIPIFHAVTNVAQTFATNASVKIENFGNVITDNVNAFNPTTSQYTVATTGYYQVAASLQTNVNTSSTIQLFKNGAVIISLSNNIAGQIISPGNPSPPLLFNAGDVLEIYMYSNGGETTFSGNGCRWSLVMINTVSNGTSTGGGGKQFVLIDGVKLNGSNNILSLPTTTSLKIGGLAQAVYGKFSGETKLIFTQDITYPNAAAIPVFGLGGNTNSTNPNANLDVAIKNINSYGNGGSNINFILAINSAGTLFAIPAPNATPNSNFVDGLLDISTITSGQIGFQLNPLKAYRHNGTAIELYDFILMGQVNWNGTVFSSLINYAFNRTKKTNKGSIVASTFITDTPNIGSDMSFRYEMVCKIAQGGYQVGDKINSFVYLSSGVANIIHSSNDNNTCRIFIPGSNLSAYQKTVGVVFALTYANWDVIFYSEGNY